MYEALVRKRRYFHVQASYVIDKGRQSGNMDFWWVGRKMPTRDTVWQALFKLIRHTEILVPGKNFGANFSCEEASKEEYLRLSALLKEDTLRGVVDEGLDKRSYQVVSKNRKKLFSYNGKK